MDLISYIFFFIVWRKRRYYLCLQCENLTGVSEQKNAFEAPVFVVVDAGVIFPNRRLWYCKFSQATIYSAKRQVCFVFCHANAPALSQTWLCPLRWGWGAVCVCVCGQGWGWGGLGSCDWWVYYSHTSFLFISPALLLNLLVASRWSSKSFFFFCRCVCRNVSLELAPKSTFLACRYETCYSAIIRVKMRWGSTESRRAVSRVSNGRCSYQLNSRHFLPM